VSGGIDILRAFFASTAVVLCHEMSIRFDCMTAYVRDDVGKMTMQAATFRAKICRAETFGCCLLLFGAMVLAYSIKYGVVNETNAAIASALVFFGRCRLRSLIKA
jgi:hypothetical protein